MLGDDWRWGWTCAVVLLVVVVALGVAERCGLDRAEALIQRGWSTPVKISKGTGSPTAEWPSLAVTGSTTVTVIWQDDRLGSVDDLYFTVSGDGGITWPTEDAVVYTSTRNSEQPRLAVGSDGRVHAVWSWAVTPTRQILYSVRSGDSWSSPVTVVTATNAIEPAVAVDSAGGAHVVWADESDGGLLRVYYNQSNDGINWTSPYSLSGATVPVAAGPAIAIDGDDLVHVVWWDATGTSSYIRYNTGDGTPGDWQVTPTELVSVSLPYADRYPDVTCDTDGNVHVVWCEWRGANDNQQVMYVEKPNGQSWGTPQAISESQMGVYGILPSYLLPKVAAWAEGGVGIVWHGSTDIDNEDEDIWFAEKTAGDWMSVSDIRHSVLDRDLNPTLAVDLEGTVHVVWQREIDSEQYAVYYSRVNTTRRRLTLPLVMKRE